MSRQFIRLNGVHFNNPGLPVVSSTELEQFIDRLPGLRLWAEPESRFEYQGSGKGLIDRKNLYRGGDSGGLGYALGASINGRPTANFVRGTNGQGFSWSNVADFQFLESGYTVFGVMKASSHAFSIFGASDGSAQNLNVGVLSDLRIAAIHGGFDAARSAYSNGPVWTAGTPFIVMVAFDAQTGSVVIELNGVEVQIAHTISAPVLDGITRVGINRVSGIGIGADAAFGTVLVLDRSYAKPEFAAAKASLYAQWAAKYGITLAA